MHHTHLFVSDSNKIVSHVRNGIYPTDSLALTGPMVHKWLIIDSQYGDDSYQGR